MHAHCCANHMPCPDGWTNRSKQLGNRGPEEPQVPVTPPSGIEAEATNLYLDYMAKMKSLREAHSEKTYPQSPGQPGTKDFSIAPLVNLGVESGATAQTGSVIQWEKPKQADHIKLLQFPKPGTSFDRWWDHAIDSIPSATTYVHEASSAVSYTHLTLPTMRTV